LEGLDAEVLKRQDIVKRAATFKHEDIQVLGEGQYLVRSQSHPSQVYYVNLEAYTCDCPNYPLISYCKHICAVQRLFTEESGSSNGTPAPTTPQVPSLVILPLDLSPPSDSINAVTLRNRDICALAEKLERTAAHLRGHQKTPLPDNVLTDLEQALDTIILATDGSSVLPTTQRLAPVVKGPSARQSMMPNIKTRCTPAGD
jgi:hypothetical protein